MNWGQAGLIGYGSLFVIGLIVSGLDRARRRIKGEG